MSEATRWDVPAIDVADNAEMMTAGRLEALQKEVYDEAFAKGRSDGIAAGEASVAQRIERLEALLTALAEPFEQLDERVEKQLVDLAMATVKQLFRREVRLDPTHVIGVIREGLAVLRPTTNKVLLHLHPEDAQLVRESLTPVEGDPAWSVVEDPLISRGGCTVLTENSRIDATIETRLESAINAVVGDERQ
ncbi:MAG: flagellar assembly protein FliH [Pseudomonadota bacterium]